MKIKKKQNEEKAEEIYNKLNLYNSDFDKQDLIKKIMQENFNQEQVQEWVNEKIAKNIYDTLKQSDEVDISKFSEEEVKTKIKELKFNINDIKNEYKKNEPIPVPVPVPIPKDEELVEEIYQFLKENYGIDDYKDEDEVKDKIRELKCDKDAVIQWVETEVI